MKPRFRLEPDLSRCSFNLPDKMYGKRDVQFDHGRLHAIRGVCGLLVEILVYRLGAPKHYDRSSKNAEVQNVPFDETSQS